MATDKNGQYTPSAAEIAKVKAELEAKFDANAKARENKAKAAKKVPSTKKAAPITTAIPTPAPTPAPAPITEEKASKAKELFTNRIKDTDKASGF